MKNCCIIVLFCALAMSSCRNKQQEMIFATFQEWEQKEIKFPSHSVFTIQGKDTVEYHLQDRYKIIVYIDSTGCTSCKLQLPEWKKFVETIDLLYPNSTQFLFYLTPREKQEIHKLLLEDRFKYPICIDKQDSINIINHFPSNINFQTFLLDRENRVIAIGNPIHNFKVKELYLKIISGEKIQTTKKNKLQTGVEIKQTVINLGTFDWKQEQSKEFLITNVGNNLLVVNDIATSCGCIVVEYLKEPVASGKSLILKVKYRADHPEHFSKTITVYCNAESSPIKFTISGNAK